MELFAKENARISWKPLVKVSMAHIYFGIYFGAKFHIIERNIFFSKNIYERYQGVEYA
jgi:hypothetical protein